MEGTKDSSWERMSAAVHNGIEGVRQFGRRAVFATVMGAAAVTGGAESEARESYNSLEHNVAFDTVDVIEINHFYDENGRHVFDQAIFYDWCGVECRHQVRAWRLVKTPNQIPALNHTRGLYEATWQDGDVLRKIHAGSVRETWTQYDPELVERTSLPREQRRELHRPKVPVCTP